MATGLEFGRSARRTMRAMSAAAVLLAALAGCGGGGDGGEPIGPSQCTAESNKLWLREYFTGIGTFGARPWYFWYALSPRPDPAAYASEVDYFDALLYTGGDPSFPADRWSNFESTEEFNRFYGAGQTLGYGIFVAGVEVQGNPAAPLVVRYIEPLSPAAAAGVVRGDRVVSINGRTASELISANDYSVLTPSAAGQSVSLVLADAAGANRTVSVGAAVYTLSPVTGARVLTTPLGRRMGYLHVKDMIDQANTPLSNAFALFRANGVTELAIDLRYNGGGLVSTAARIASYVGGPVDNGRVFSRLLYNDQQQANNRDYLFVPPEGDPNKALNLARVFVLAGPRTCSASEQLVNGLRGLRTATDPGIEVVLVGDTSCGKPVGFLPQDNGCGTTYNVVNFESVNARSEGRYFDGFTACAVAEDHAKPLGAPNEPLLAEAQRLADGGVCIASSGAAGERPQSARQAGQARRPWLADGGERPAMIPR